MEIVSGIRIRPICSVWGATSTLAMCFVATGSSLMIASPAQAEELFGPMAKEITVRIDGPTTSGSGVIVDRNANDTYTVLTNWHVVDQEGDYDIVTADGETHYAHYDHVQQINGLDLAVIFFNSSDDYRLASLGSDSNNLVLGQTVFAAGWLNPSPSFARHGFRFITGSLSGVEEEPNDNGYALSFSAPGAFVGTSGGPLMNQEGQVIGILGSGETDIFGEFTGLYLGLPINLYLASSFAETPLIETPPVFQLNTPNPRHGRPSVITSPRRRDSNVCSGYQC